MDKRIFEKYRGFTILEVLLTLVIVATVFSFVISFSHSMQLRTSFRTFASEIVSEIRDVQSLAESSCGNRYHGVHLESDYYVVFEGQVYDPFAATSFRVDLPASLTLQNISLNGGGSDLLFESPDGKTDNYGSFELFSSQISEVALININQLGFVNLQ